MPIIPVTDTADERLAIYRDLRHPDAGRSGRRFIVEGEHVVRRLLKSDYGCESLLIVDRKAEAFASLAPPGTPVYTATEPAMTALLGFKFHSGVMGCAWRKPPAGLDDVEIAAALRGEDDAGVTVSATGDPGRRRGGPIVVVLPELTDAANLGSIIRLCAGFGVALLLLGPRCRDPFFRQTVRVSMGMVFGLRVMRSDDLERDLRRLRDDYAYQLTAVELRDGATPLAGATRPRKIALLFGNERPGVDETMMGLCERAVIIPMRQGVDSLNVAMTAAVVLYHFSDVAGAVMEG